MTLPSSGPISASDINIELGRASNAPFDINGSAERALAGIPSGPISFSDFWGKSAGGGGSITPGTGSGWGVNSSATNYLPVATQVARAIITFNANGTVQKTRNSPGTGTTNSAGKNWFAPTTTGAGIGCWARIVIDTANTDSGPLTISTAAGSVPDDNNPYTLDWNFSAAPGVWFNLASGMNVRTGISIPGSSSTYLGESMISIDGRIQFATSSSGPLVYEEPFSLTSVTFGI